MHKFLLSLFVFFLYVCFPIYIIIHDVPITSRISIIPILIAGFVLWRWFKAKDQVMKAIREKEQQEKSRTIKTEFYFAFKFVIVFVIAYIFFRLVNFKFDTITFKMELIGISYFLGWIFRSRKLQLFGV